jgi:DNA-binding response OmpR family regulator
VALRRVLIADDSRVFRLLMVDVLMEHGLEVLEASTGRDALEILLSQRPQLAILDGLLPLLSGFDIITKLREAAPDYKPVTFLVTGVYKSHRWRSEGKQEYQVEEYLEKPLEPEDLIAAIRRHFPDLPEPAPRS